jgi:hypothetical protein
MQVHRSVMRTVTALGFVPLLLLVGTSALGAPPPERETQLVVFGDDSCPTPTSENEVVVCARRPESERYRIPPALRHPRDEPSSVSWAAANEALDDAQRQMRPNSCSVVGSYGQTGCAQEMVRQWYYERRGQRY